MQTSTRVSDFTFWARSCSCERGPVEQRHLARRRGERRLERVGQVDMGTIRRELTAGRNDLLAQAEICNRIRSDENLKRMGVHGELSRSPGQGGGSIAMLDATQRPGHHGQRNVPVPAAGSAGRSSPSASCRLKPARIG